MQTKNTVSNSRLVEENGSDGKGKGKDSFGSSLGIILSCLGSVVGTGNVWRFPRIAARNSHREGSLTFLMVWFIFLFLWSVPMILIEYGMGRYTGASPIKSIKYFLGQKALWCGSWIFMVAFFIGCYYSVVVGWCLYYVYYSFAVYELPKSDMDSSAVFYHFTHESYWPVLCHSLSILLTFAATMGGIKWVEKSNTFLVPLFLMIIIFTFVWSLTRKYADFGIEFLFTPSWESLKNPRLWVDAATQNAFDTAAAAGLIMAYSSYLKRDNGIVRYSVVIPFFNNLVSFTCGITIFSTVFATMIEYNPTMTKTGILEVLQTSGVAGTGITFIWIPVFFSELGLFGRVLCSLYFICLFCAGLSSLIAALELNRVTLTDFGVPVKFATPISALAMLLVGLGSALDIRFLANQDFVWGFGMLFSGIVLQVAVIRYGANKFRRVVINEYGSDDWNLPYIWVIFVKFLCPLEAVCLISWWVYSVISENPHTWYTLNWETLMTTWLEWFIVIVLLILLNITLLIMKPRWLMDTNFIAEIEVEERNVTASNDTNEVYNPAFTNDDGYEMESWF